MLKLHGVIGQVLINDALGQFENIAKKFEDGIHHCNAEMDNHQKEISEKQLKIRELCAHVEKASRVLGKIKEFIA